MERWRTVTGEMVSENRVDLHHVFFCRNKYKSPQEKQFRQLGGLVLPILITVHRELHGEIAPPPKPSHNLMNLIGEYSNNDYHDTYEAFSEIAWYIGDLANSATNQQLAEEAFAIHQNLVDQSAYIAEGRITNV
jgi:hypothetical protein